LRTNTVEFLWQESRANNGFHTGVSLHSHTMYSQEGLTFIPRYAARVPILAWEFERQHRKYQACHGKPFDFTAAYWTPPLPGREAYEIERSQIETGLGLKAMVSLTDHDNIEAGTQLQVLEPDIPISVEWTIPFEETYFHIGIHNLPRQSPRDLMAALAGYTADPKPRLLAELLAGLDAEPGVLIVLNHPMWDQGCLGPAGHKAALLKLIASVGDRLHAVELNGLRPWAENRAVMELARNLDRILISGGDRHGREPNASINLTASASFEEFASEVRSGQSHVLFMPQYREPLGLRILQTLCDVLRDSPELAGRQSWADRIFYAPRDRNFVPLSSVWKQGGPAVVRWFVRGVELIGHARVQRLLRVLVRRNDLGPAVLEFTGLPGTSPAP
jgi:hypothetical protein